MSPTAAEAFSIGDIRCQVVPDGVATYRKETFFGNVTPGELDSALEGQLNDAGLLPVPYNGLLLRAGEEVVLIDSGAGEEQAEEWGEPVGQLHGWLREEGIAPEEIDVVILSHAHIDHIGGLTRSVEGRREPVFSRARHLLSGYEWDFWMSDEATARFEYLTGKARTHLSALEEAGLLEKVESETEVLPGIRLMPTPGHTPGHLSVGIESRDDHALFAGDVFLHELNFEHRSGARRLRRSPISPSTPAGGCWNRWLNSVTWSSLLICGGRGAPRGQTAPIGSSLGTDSRTTRTVRNWVSFPVTYASVG